MSLSSTTHKPIPRLRGLSAKATTSLSLALTLAVVIAILIQVPGPSGANPASARLSPGEFLELNTTALPPAASAVGVAHHGAGLLERFVEINTTGMPSLADTSGENVSVHFLYWNVDSFGRATAKSALGEGANAVTPVSGPR